MLKKLIPHWAREEWVALRETLLDSWRYQRATCSNDRLADRSARAARHEARLTMEYHSVEKSLSLPNPRRPFGVARRPRAERLVTSTPEQARDLPYQSYAVDALSALDQWNESGTIDPVVSPLFVPPQNAMTRVEAEEFFASRHSVRHFDLSRPLTRAEILSAVELARNTPSVCNRQGFRAHIFESPELISRILRLQGGATGFSDAVPALAVVTARRALFVGPLERNQRWVDGGLFAMTLVWALHAVGVDSCMLNWAMAGRTTDELRRLAGIPDGEDVVVLVAMGHAAPGARVARSAKRTADDLAIFHSGIAPQDLDDPHSEEG